MQVKSLLPALICLQSSHAVAEMPTYQLDEILVTATRFQSDEADRPIAAQVITADEIRDSSAMTVAEVLSKLGGVHARINFTGVSDLPLDLRGFGMTGDQNTLVLLNGQRISEYEGNAPARLSSIPVDAVERIEILRGAGAVLYGGGASAGTINIITRTPVGDGVAGNVSATAGSHDLRDLRAGIQAGGGPWGLNLNAQHYESDNYRDNNRAEQDVGSGELRYGRGDDFVALGFNADDQQGRLPGGRTESQLSGDPRGTSTPNDYMDSQGRSISLRGEKRFGDVTFAIDVGQRNKAASMYSETAWGTSKMDTEVEVTTFSPRILFKTQLAGMDNRLAVGLDWSDWDYANDTLATGWLTSLDETGKQRNRAIYFRDELNLSSATRLSLGGRRENVEQIHEEQLVPRPRSEVEHHLSAYEVALQHDLGDGASVYGRIGRSYRVANIDENRCWYEPCPALLKPQRSQDREIGVQWSNKKGAAARASVFDMAVDDEIHYMNIGPYLFGSNVNLPPTRHRGLELEGHLFVGAKFDVAARYTWTQATFREGNYGGVDVTGNEVPLVPAHRFGLSLGWQATPATKVYLYVNHVGSQRYDNDQANLFRRMPGYTVADIKVSHESGAWRLAAGINNLFDEAYYSYGIVNGGYTSFNAYPEDRRNAYLTAEYRF